jgi:hypothetical protein
LHLHAGARWAALAAAAALLVAARAPAFPNEPTGFFKVPFGASLEELKKHYPAVEFTTEPLGAPVVQGGVLKRYVLRDAPRPYVGGKGTIELRLRKDRLWVIIVYCPDLERDALLAALTKEFGPPGGRPDVPTWDGERALVALQPGYVIYQDKAILAEALREFGQAAKEARDRGEIPDLDRLDQIRPQIPTPTAAAP